MYYNYIMTDDNFFDELLTKSKHKKSNNNMLDNLYKIPLKDKGVNRPTFQYYEPNIYQQADLLFLPDDSGYKYALVISDVGSRLSDAQQIKTKSNDDVTNAFKIIYKRNILKIPKIIMVDPGSEFKGTTNTYLTSLKIHIKTNVKDRHRQNAIVERANQTIGTLIHKRQASQELITGHTSRAWVDDLSLIIRAINRKVVRTKQPKQDNEPHAVGDSSILLNVGDRVRVMLEVPESVSDGTKLHGKFRSGDIRWNRTIRIISEVLLGPNSPPMYLLENINKHDTTNIHPFDTSAAYTKNQLQLVKNNEIKPSFEQIRPEQDNVYIVDTIIGKKIDNKKIFYKIHWKGYPSSYDSWEPYKTINDDVPDVVKQFEDTHKMVAHVVPKKQHKQIIIKNVEIIPPVISQYGRTRVGVKKYGFN